ncbi:unnamed protein product, partial [Brassica oleracea var. botrytis]
DLRWLGSDSALQRGERRSQEEYGLWTRPKVAFLFTISTKPRFSCRIMPVLLPVSFRLIIPSMLIIISLWIVLIRPSVLTHLITPTVPHMLSIILTHRRPYWSSVWNHDLEMDLIDSLH